MGDPNRKDRYKTQNSIPPFENHKRPRASPSRFRWCCSSISIALIRATHDAAYKLLVPKDIASFYAIQSSRFPSATEGPSSGKPIENFIDLFLGQWALPSLWTGVQQSVTQRHDIHLTAVVIVECGKCIEEFLLGR